MKCVRHSVVGDVGKTRGLSGSFLCPSISSGVGRVVTGTFTHVRGGILLIKLAGLAEPLGVTSNHSIYSADRLDFVPAGELRVGETLRNLDGVVRIESIEQLGSEERVYNLEIHGEHVFRVASSGLLVHNSSGAEGTVSTGTTRTPIKLAEAGEDLFVGGYAQVRRANIKSGLNATHTPHHSVQDAVSGTSHSTGVSINLLKDLHALTRTFRKPVEEGLSLRQHLSKDVWDVKNILTNANYDRSVINAQLKELIRQNKPLGGFTK